MTEFFGPVLGVMRFEKLHDAIAMVNQTGFGLTSGLESLDDREQAEWKASIRAGNLYINRSTVGAIVLRQPFGGMGKSAFGPGLKAGGPNYVAQFMRFTEKRCRGRREESLFERCAETKQGLVTSSSTLLEEAMNGYRPAWEAEFSREHDHFLLIGQDNVRRYLPVRALRIRVHADDTSFDLFARVAAARIVGCRITVSTPHGPEPEHLTRLHEATEAWAAAIEFIDESDDELADAILCRECDRVRYASPARVPLVVRRAAAESLVFIADASVLAEGRIELLWYLQEQSVSFDYHRYGNLGTRASEARAPITPPTP
jgi:RHH-type proline utilization regulon transcriptional repressor/proline dehydrogenase/delta 1-pyrroline-5-carboxylate dehydrogenase